MTAHGRVEDPPGRVSINAAATIRTGGTVGTYRWEYQLGADQVEFAVGAVRRMEALRSPYERAEALDVLGRIAHQRGDVAAAAGHYRGALAVFEELGSARADGVREGRGTGGTQP